MPSADFAAAQERLAARRRQRHAEARSQAEALQSAHLSALSRVPYPLDQLGNAGFRLWDVVKGREGTQPAFRVGQVDAELLDAELLELLKGQVGEALKYFGSHIQDEYSAEILLVLRALLFKLTIWDHNASYGASLQGLHYADARDKTSAHPPPKMWQKAIYGLVTVFGRYGWTKWEDFLLERTEDHATETPSRLQHAQRLTSAVSTAHSVFALTSFLVFLVNGRYRTLLDRILRLRLTPTTHATSREVSFEYLNRQLVWHAFTEFLLFLLPLVGIHRWRRMLSRAWRKIRSFFAYIFLSRHQPSFNDDDIKASGELGFLPVRTCAICYKDQNPTGSASEAELLAATASGGVIGSAATDITNPYEAVPCGCIYCYVCLAQRIDAEEGEGWTCLRCGELVKECKAWVGDVVEDSSRRSPGQNGKSVGFSEVEPTSASESDMVDMETPTDPDGEGNPEIRHLSTVEAFDQSASTSLDESALWAQSRRIASDDDEQSEEYDEEEDELNDIDGI